MFNLTDLKKTRFYQDVFAEAQAQAQAEVAQAQAEAKQREKAAILRVVGLGLTKEQIVTVFDLPVAEVEATIADL